jgi:hypothetical protein
MLTSQLLTRLSEIGGQSLGPSLAPASRAALLRRVDEQLLYLLNEKNGFYAFEGSLHVFAVGQASGEPDLFDWNSDGLWRSEFSMLDRSTLFFAEDAFGGQFGLKDGSVVTFDPETGETSDCAESLQGWAGALLNDYRLLTGYPVAHAWQIQFGSIPPGMRLVPRTPFVLGGSFDIENLIAMPAVEAMRSRARLAAAINGRPDGAQIEYRSP